MLKILLAGIGWMLIHVGWAQELKGTILDAQTEEGIPFARILVKDLGISAVADAEGAFVLEGSFPETIDILVSATYYESKELQVNTREELTLKLTPDLHQINEIVVVVDPGIMGKNTTAKVERLNIQSLQMSGPTSVVDAATNIPGVQMVSAGLSAPKPVIRGMQGIRVVTLVNGMRVENQQWGADHGLGISQLGVEAVEIIKGPAGLEYAGDALGGTMYIKDQNSVMQNRYYVDISSGFESVNLGVTNSVLARFAHKNVRYSVGGLSTSNADYQLADGRYLHDSRFQDHGFKFNLGANKNNWNIRANYLFSHSNISIPGHTHDSIVTPESFIFEERGRSPSRPLQLIRNHMVNVVNSFRKNYKHRFDVRTVFTSNDLAEYEKVFTPAIRMILNTATLEGKYVWERNYGTRLTLGANSRYQWNRNDPDAEEQILQDYEQFDHAAFGLFFWSVGPFEFEFAARGDYRTVTSSDFTADYLTPNGSVGGTFKWWGYYNNKVRLNIASGTRAPHLSELLSNGVHHGTSRYEIGDRSLQPERVTQFDLDYTLEDDHIDFLLNPFYSYAQNYIQLAATDSMIDGQDVYNYVAIEQARLYGVDAGLHYHPHFAHLLHWESGFSIIYGESFEGQPLYWIPQARLRNKIRLKLNYKKKIGFNGVMVQHQYFFPQDRIGELETVTAGYHLLNAGANVEYRGKVNLDITFGVRNALNSNYVNHLSRLKNLGLTEPGRSFYIKVTLGVGGIINKEKYQEPNYDGIEII